MLEWYQGYEDTDSFGEKVRMPGFIQKLLNEAQRVKESSNLGERFGNRTFGNFDPRFEREMFNICRTYANNDNLFRARKNSLLLTGNVGTGKTHMAAAIANTLIDRGVPVLFGTFNEHLEHIREEFDHTGQRQYLSMMKNTPLLVLDDLGKERKTDWTQQILFDVVNYRYEHLLPIVITTNMSLDETANHTGAAIFSRLYEMSAAYNAAGKDYRKQ